MTQTPEQRLTKQIMIFLINNLLIFYKFML